jgi:hypothetical protein
LPSASNHYLESSKKERGPVPNAQTRHWPSWVNEGQAAAPNPAAYHMLPPARAACNGILTLAAASAGIQIAVDQGGGYSCTVFEMGQSLQCAANSILAGHGPAVNNQGCQDD